MEGVQGGAAALKEEFVVVAKQCDSLIFWFLRVAGIPKPSEVRIWLPASRQGDLTRELAEQCVSCLQPTASCLCSRALRVCTI